MARCAVYDLHIKKINGGEKNMAKIFGLKYLERANTVNGGARVPSVQIASMKISLTSKPGFYALSPDSA